MEHPIQKNKKTKNLDIKSSCQVLIGLTNSVCCFSTDPEITKTYVPIPSINIMLVLLKIIGWSGEHKQGKKPNLLHFC